MSQDKYRPVILRLNDVSTIVNHSVKFHNEVVNPGVIERIFEGVSVEVIENSLDFIVSAHHKRAYLKFSEGIVPNSYWGELCGLYAIYLSNDNPSEKSEYEREPVMTIRIDKNGNAHCDGESVTCWPDSYNHRLTVQAAGNWIISAIQKRITLSEPL